MRKRTPSEIKAYGNGYAEAYKEFCHLLDRHDKDKAIRKMKIFADAVALTVETATDTADTPQTDCDNKDEPQTNGYQTFNGTSVYVSRLTDEPQTDNGIGCSRCGGRFDCYDRDMPHAVHCNNYGKITDEPRKERGE